jgi:hypothetical protein
MTLLKAIHKFLMMTLFFGSSSTSLMRSIIHHHAYIKPKMANGIYVVVRIHQMNR